MGRGILTVASIANEPRRSDISFVPGWRAEVEIVVNESRPIRRSRSEIGAIKVAIYNLLWEDRPMTVRQVFYRLVSAGVIGKTEGEYKSTVVRLLGEMRRNHEIRFDWIADNTRWQRKPLTFSSLESMLKHSAQAYRRSVWDNQDAYVEVWLEKDALAGVLFARDCDLGCAVDGDTWLSVTLIFVLSS